MNRTNNEEKEEEEDRRIEELLDAVDERTKIQTMLHDALSNGFMWIARERYRDALATYRLQNVVSDARAMRSSVHVSVVDQFSKNTDDDDKSVLFTKFDDDDDVFPHANNNNNSDDDDNNNVASSNGIRRRRHTQQEQTDDASTTELQRRVARTDDDDDVVQEEGEEEEISQTKRKRIAVMAMPSKEVREAVQCFNESIALAISLASQNNMLMRSTL